MKFYSKMLCTTAFNSWLSVRVNAMVKHVIITRVRIPTAGLAFDRSGRCSYRVRGVEGSCAKHLTIEFHTVVMLLTFIFIIII